MAAFLDGRVALVTGGAGGIGMATCAALAREGARVILSDYSEAAAATAIAALNTQGLEADLIVADVTSEASVEQLIDQILARHGRLDCAFNNAGIEHRGLPLTDLSSAQWQQCLSVDLTGVFLCLKYQIPAMLKNGGGTIVNNSAGMVETAVPYAAEYVAAKHGVIGLTRSAAIEFGPSGIRVNAVLPGPIKTEMLSRVFNDPASDEMLTAITSRIPLGRLGEPAEIADAVVWLLSGKSSFVNGASIPVDGGFVIA